MAQYCPIDGSRVDERAARLSAFFVTLLLVATFATSFYWLSLALALDFLLRSSSKDAWRRISPLGALSRGVLRLIRAPQRKVDGAPKRFAARIGLLFSLSLFALLSLGMPSMAVGLGLVFGLCAALEAFVGFCVGCKVYGYLLPLCAKNREATLGQSR